MRAAIPTNDKNTIFKRSGRAEGFLIVDITADGYKKADYRKNSHSHHHHNNNEEDEHGHSHKEIVDDLKDCQYLIVNMIGKHFGGDIKSAGINIFKTDAVLVDEAIQKFQKEVLN